jgi:thiosulfate/3-mercaptopyruvate sulfurtransferase
MARAISTAVLAQRLADPHVAIVDVRPLAAYNGWRLRGEARGGHIPRAVACPRVWAPRLGDRGVLALLARRGVDPSQTVVVYGDDAAAGDEAAAWLTSLGFDHVLAYREGFVAWAAAATLPLARLPRYARLLPPQILSDLIAGQLVPELASPSFLVLHVSDGPPAAYAQGHLPGAVHLDSNALEEAGTWNRRPMAAVRAVLLAHGITHNTTAILYGSGEGQLAALRAATIMLDAGVADVRLLDGGLAAWTAAGYAVARGERAPRPAPTFGAPLPARSTLFVDGPALRRLREDARTLLVCTRSWAEFVGETSGYDYIVRKGRLPGSVWGNVDADAYPGPPYRSIDQSMRDYEEIAATWAGAGITGERRVIFYCGTGWRAAEAYFCAYLMGWSAIAIYDGGWFEWSADPENPIESGAPAPPGGTSPEA